MIDSERQWLRLLKANPDLEAWQVAWRIGFAPGLSEAHLLTLKDALLSDDVRLIRGLTVEAITPGLPSSKPIGACAIGYCGWKGDGLKTAQEISDFFALHCRLADTRLGSPALCRHFLTEFDEWSREEMRTNLLPEVELELARRTQPQQQDERVLVADGE